MSHQVKRRIAFVLRDPSYFRYVDGIIRRLLERGHSLTLISPLTSPSKHQYPFDIRNIVKSIAAQAASHGTGGDLVLLPLTVDERWRTTWLGTARMLRSYGFWLSGERQWSHRERERWVTFLPWNVRRVFRWVGRHRVEALLKLKIVQALLARAERLARPHPAVVRQLRELDHDVVIATPVVYPIYSGEVDYFKAARMLRRPNAVLVASWDHLTVRGIFPMVPDAVLVWNEAQVHEAVHIHGLPKDKIVAAGAPVFDEWFSLGCREPREVFCQRAGLNPFQPYVVYAVSAPVFGDESAIVTTLASELTIRGGDSGIQVLVRPHPNHELGLKRMIESGLRVWPPAGAFPQEADQKRDYFNTLYHAAAVIGLNTSVFLEAMILDKPCVSISPQVAARAPFRHYEHLVNADCCEFVADEAAAAAAVINLLRGQDTKRKARRDFIKTFIRPHGLNKPAAQVAAEVIEALCSAKTPPQPLPIGIR